MRWPDGNIRIEYRKWRWGDQTVDIRYHSRLGRERQYELWHPTAEVSVVADISPSQVDAFVFPGNRGRPDASGDLGSVEESIGDILALRRHGVRGDVQVFVVRRQCSRCAGGEHDSCAGGVSFLETDVDCACSCVLKRNLQDDFEIEVPQPRAR